MGERKTAGLSRDSAYEGAGWAAPLLYLGISQIIHALAISKFLKTLNETIQFVFKFFLVWSNL